MSVSEVDTLTDLRDVWDMGVSLPYGVPEGAEMLTYFREFKNRTGSQRVVALRWVHGGVVHEWPSPASPLPDLSELVVPSGLHPYKKLLVINADGTQRCEITVPCIDERSRPEYGYLELPPSQNHLGVDWGMMCHDGFRRYLLDIDWETGKVIRHVVTPLPWM